MGIPLIFTYMHVIYANGLKITFKCKRRREDEKI